MSVIIHTYIIIYFACARLRYIILFQSYTNNKETCTLIEKKVYIFGNYLYK